MVTSHYQVIWDCCCDHGLLGMTLLERNAAKTVHFVDAIEPLVTSLKGQLEQYFPIEEFQNHLHVQCLDVAKITLLDINQQLIIIAGVGGERTIKLIHSIMDAHPNHHFEFLLCPVHQNYQVREFLISKGFGLIDECLVKENGRFYELLHVKSNQPTPITLVGSTMWDFNRSDDRDYLNKLITHYQHKAKIPETPYSKILAAYQQLKLD